MQLHHKRKYLNKMHSIQEGHDKASNEVEVEKWIEKTCEYVIPIADKIHDPLNQRKDQIAFLGKYFF